jgi:transposase
MMVLNIICASRPLYRVQEWLTDYTDGISEKDIYAAQYNDDRLGRNLDKLFKADRSSMLTELSANAIKLHNLRTDNIHNDSTSVTFTGEYENSNKANVNLARGFNKDHRPDCKQIVFDLNITSDGNVPLSFQLFDGNQTDDKTHIPNWDELRKLIEKEDFIYIADCKLCSIENLNHIHINGGIFITLVPKNRKEAKAFHKHIQKVDIEWEDAMIVEDSRKKGKETIYRTFEQDKTQEGYRIIWVHSSSKKEQDKKRRDMPLKKVTNSWLPFPKNSTNIN